MTQFSYGVLLQVLTLCSPRKTTQKFLCGSMFLSVNPNYDLTEDDGTVGHIKRCDRELSPDITDYIDGADYNEVYNCFAQTIIPHLYPEDLPLIIGSLSFIVGHATNIGKEYPICSRDNRTQSFYLRPGEVDPAEFLTDLFFLSVKAVPNTEGANFVKQIDSKGDLRRFILDEACFKVKVVHYNFNPVLAATIRARNFEQAFEEISITDLGLPNDNEIRIYRLKSEDYEFSDARLKKFLTDNIGRYIFSRSRIEQFRKEDDEENIGIEAAQYLRDHLSGNEFGEIMIYSFLEEVLEAPKLFSRVEFTSDLGKSDGIHLRRASGQIGYQLVYGASDVRGDIRGAIEAALIRVQEIKNNRPTPYQIVNSASFAESIPDEGTGRFIKSIILPSKKGQEPPATAFGIFIAYTISMSEEDSFLPLQDYKLKMAAKLKQDVCTYASYIKKRLLALGLHQHSFFVYVLPLNDADNDKHRIIQKVIGGAK